MVVHFVYECDKVDWVSLMKLLNRSNMRTYAPEIHKQAFENSYRAVFLYDEDKLIGCCRLLSDGVYQGAIYDVAIDEQYRGAGLGTKLVKELIVNLENINILLYASPGKESFYNSLGFSCAKTGMVKFIDTEGMKEKGFI